MLPWHSSYIFSGDSLQFFYVHEVAFDVGVLKRNEGEESMHGMHE